MKIELDIKNCLDCPNHVEGYDPDPYDSFNSDDMYCACKLLPNDRIPPDRKYVSDRQEFRIVTCSERPYQLRKNCEIPKWCPLLKPKKRVAKKNLTKEKSY